MKVSAKAEYACLAMLELAAHHGAQPVRVKAIAEAQGITQHFLIQILLQLKVAGLVTSVRGASGGYQLARSPEEISLACILRALDDRALGCPADAEESRTRASALLQSVWQEVHALEEQVLAGLSLAELLRRGQPPDTLSYQI